MSVDLADFWRAKWDKFGPQAVGAIQELQDHELWTQSSFGRLYSSRPSNASSEAARSAQSILGETDQVVEELLSVPHWQTAVSTIHGDLNLSNVLVAGDVPCMIDFEDVCHNRPTLYDLVKLEVELGNHVLSSLEPGAFYQLYQVVNRVCLLAGSVKSEPSCLEQFRDGLLEFIGFPRRVESAQKTWKWALPAGEGRNGFQLILRLRQLSREITDSRDDVKDWYYEYSRWLCLYALVTLGFTNLNLRQKLAALTMAFQSYLFWRLRP
jgi:hypothetical protein